MMKIIDLAEKQRNSEILPKHIRYADEDLYFDGVSYYDKEGNNSLIDILAMNYQALTHLYDKVEIIEEEKKIPEKLDVELLGQCDNWLRYGTTEETIKDYELNPYIIDTIRRNTLEFQHKINSIIDYLKSKGE